MFVISKHNDFLNRHTRKHYDISDSQFKFNVLFYCSMETFKVIDIPKNTLLSFKLSPGHNFDDSAFSGQSEADWSALYSQFNFNHALSYLYNHYDRGSEKVMLYSITCKRNMKAIIFKDERMKENTINSSIKAEILLTEICNNVSDKLKGTKKPLLQSIGEELEMIVILYDCEQLECVIPHCMMQNPINFNYNILARFDRNEQNSSMTQFVTIENEISLKLTKEEKWNVITLADKLKTVIAANNCPWISEYS